jgi:hypothetical protein
MCHVMTLNTVLKFFSRVFVQDLRISNAAVVSQLCLGVLVQVSRLV